GMGDIAQDVQQDRSDVRSPRHRSICLSDQQKGSLVHDLVQGPVGGSLQRTSLPLDPMAEPLHLSSMELDTPGHPKGQDGETLRDFGDPLLEVDPLVPGSQGLIDLQSTSDPCPESFSRPLKRKSSDEQEQELEASLWWLSGHGMSKRDSTIMP
ncbi:hypothetical protein AX774_g7804, partial [Zancudomyces culisetae]